jgi:hypothetical protein
MRRNNCKFCEKVKSRLTSQSGKIYGACRPHALIQSYKANPCRGCSFEFSEGSCYSENDRDLCKKGAYVCQTGSSRGFHTLENGEYGNDREKLRKTIYGFKYTAINGNCAYIVMDKVLQYKYFGAILNLGNHYSDIKQIVGSKGETIFIEDKVGKFSDLNEKGDPIKRKKRTD